MTLYELTNFAFVGFPRFAWDIALWGRQGWENNACTWFPWLCCHGNQSVAMAILVVARLPLFCAISMATMMLQLFGMLSGCTRLCRHSLLILNLLIPENDILERKCDSGFEFKINRELCLIWGYASACSEFFSLFGIQSEAIFTINLVAKPDWKVSQNFYVILRYQRVTFSFHVFY